ncbi:AraC family transcriptional regulator [Rhodococcus jostii]|uniref:AraC-type DNA-binding protein n=1 Tax=Rhodococcus jostii TaxID=132919 RepID=A0A1H5D214_RHOJO|nr:helix-turn-helix transcriptional regulator [Rhodococcus jostii]SED72977.1 AraC-type DNA-binding protein [Rhodococcus jostii]
MRNCTLEDYDGLGRDVLAIGTDYSYGHVLAPHRHRRAQFLYGVGGVMDVTTAHGSWIVPSDRAVLIPAETEHAVTMRGVSTRSLYLEPSAVPWFPSTCTVVQVPPLLRELLVEADEVPIEYAVHGRDAALMALILHEVARCVALPLDLPLPVHRALREQCQLFLREPDVRTSPRWWADALHVSERTINRMFRQETSMSVTEWQRRACVLSSLRSLASGDAVSTVAADFGYASPAAFSTMFHRILGSPPSAFRLSPQA